jgi:hypothetical protein
VIGYISWFRSIASTRGVELLLEAADATLLEVSEESFVTVSAGGSDRILSADGSPSMTFWTADCVKFERDLRPLFGFCTLVVVVKDVGLSGLESDGQGHSDPNCAIRKVPVPTIKSMRSYLLG